MVDWAFLRLGWVVSGCTNQSKKEEPANKQTGGKSIFYTIYRQKGISNWRQVYFLNRLPPKRYSKRAVSICGAIRPLLLSVSHRKD
jgi:hypothetical protein